MDALSILRNVRNAVARPAQLAVKNVQRGIEAVNPWDAQSRGASLIDQAEKRYGVTPAFRTLLQAQNPSAVTGSLGANGNLSHGHQQSANYTPLAAADPLHRIKVSMQGQTNASAANSLVHEGLHSAWDTQPQRRNEFISAYNTYATPNLRAYLINRTKGYESASKQPVGAFLDLNKATPDIQNEIHSYLPEYLERYSSELPAESSTALKKYYSNYFDIDQPAAYQKQATAIAGQVNSMLGAPTPPPAAARKAIPVIPTTRKKRGL